MNKRKDAKAGGKRLRKPTTRRQFLKVAGIGGLSAASLYLLGCAAEAVTTTVTAPGTTTTVTGPGVTTTVTAPGATTTVTTGPGTTTTVTAPGTTTTITATAAPEEITWDYEVDVIVLGAGAMGIPSAIRARDRGASVMVVEANWDIGGKAITSGGFTNLGGGTSNQLAGGITGDSADIVFKDMTDWSVVASGGISDYRYTDKEVSRTYADNNVATFNFLLENGVVYPNPPTGSHWGTGISFPRGQSPFIEDNVQGTMSPMGSNGAALMRPLEASARAKGVQFMMNRHMDTIFRENTLSGDVLGVRASYSPVFNPDTGAQMTSYRSEGNIDETRENVNIKANKAVIVATGALVGNVNLRRQFHPGYTEEVQISNNAYVTRLGDGSGYLATLAIGATPWGSWLGYEGGLVIRRPSRLGLQHMYHTITPDSPVFPFSRASGLSIGGGSWQNIIMVNQVGNRFFNETANGLFPKIPTYPDLLPVEGFTRESYVHGNWRNAEITYNQSNYSAAERASNEFSEFPDYASGPKWAIFDADAVARLEWNIGYPNIDEPDYFFSGNTIAELAANIAGPYTKIPMPASNLVATVARYNGFVDTGVDTDFDKPTPEFKVETPPFYAAWATNFLHDDYNGIRVNGSRQVVDRWGEVIPRLYAGGELAGGMPMHGLQLGLCPGYIAGWHAAGLDSV